MKFNFFVLVFRFILLGEFIVGWCYEEYDDVCGGVVVIFDGGGGD